MFGIASLTTRTISDITNIQVAISNCFFMLFPVPFIFIVSLILSFKIDILLGFILLWILLIIGIISFFVIYSSIPLFKKLQKKLDSMSKVLLENITGVRVIRAFNNEENEEERLKNEFKNYEDISVKVNKRFSFIDSGTFIVVNIFVIIVYYLSGYRITNGYFLIGDITDLIEYAMLSLFFFMMAQMVILTLPRAIECLNRINEILVYSPRIIDKTKNYLDILDSNTILSFKNVSFRYDDADEYTLKDLNFDCNKNTTTAIIGGTGSGKSTVASLIMRFNEATDGKILFKGIDIKDMSQKQLRDNIAYVQQKAWLFSGTIRDNLKYGNNNVTDNDILNALEIAQAKDFVLNLPLKLDSYVSEGGTNFSGGQKQRLSIARALVKNPDIFIFDDSFSALDFKTDLKLRRALNDKLSNKAFIIIAQRISTIKNADNIIVLNEGNVCGIGKHDDLLKTCDVYKSIYESQTKEEI